MKIDFKNKTVLITGGSRGIGAEVARHFNERNAKVIVTCTNTKNIDGLDNKGFKNNINYSSLDLSSKESIKSFVSIINKEFSIETNLLHQFHLKLRLHHIVSQILCQMHLHSALSKQHSSHW